ncbi:hypothetical protein [Paenibacillus macerans]|nr:hypothetical protein [Paenibacillus macerans]MCM3697968.1 hypothetical protein [Paenibacillus macerans]
MEANAGTELQSFTSRYNSEQDCMEALIAMKWHFFLPSLSFFLLPDQMG